MATWLGNVGRRMLTYLDRLAHGVQETTHLAHMLAGIGAGCGLEDLGGSGRSGWTRCWAHGLDEAHGGSARYAGW